MAGGVIVTGPSATDRSVTIELAIDARGRPDGVRSAPARADDTHRFVCRDGTVRSFVTTESDLDTRVEVDIDRVRSPSAARPIDTAAAPVASAANEKLAGPAVVARNGKRTSTLPPFGTSTSRDAAPTGSIPFAEATET